MNDLAQVIEKNLAWHQNILDIGGTVESDWKKNFTSEIQNRIKNINLPIDARYLPVSNDSIDAILCFATLEHIDDDRAAVNEMKRVLKKGGFIFVSVPFLEAWHGSPNDYRRYTPQGLATLFDWVYITKMGAVDFFGSSMAINLTNVVGKNHLIRGSIAAYCFFWLKYFDKYFKNRPQNYKSAASIYLMGWKQ